MSASVGRALSGATRAALFVRSSSTAERTLRNARSLAVTSHMSAPPKAPADEDEQLVEPIKFSTSKASHRTWKVDRSMGSQHERPWWKVLPVSAVFTAFILWCMLREETDIDTKLGRELHEQVPSLFTEEEEAEVQSKSA